MTNTSRTTTASASKPARVADPTRRMLLCALASSGPAAAVAAGALSVGGIAMNQMITGSEAHAMAHTTGDVELLALWEQFVAQWSEIELATMECKRLHAVGIASVPAMKEWFGRFEYEYDGLICREKDVPQPTTEDWRALEATWQENGYKSANRRYEEAYRKLLGIRRAMLRKTPEGPLGIGLQLATAFLPDGTDDDHIQFRARPGVFGALRSISKMTGVDLIAALPKTIAPV